MLSMPYTKVHFDEYIWYVSNMLHKPRVEIAKFSNLSFRQVQRDIAKMYQSDNFSTCPPEKNVFLYSSNVEATMIQADGHFSFRQQSLGFYLVILFVPDRQIT